MPARESAKDRAGETAWPDESGRTKSATARPCGSPALSFADSRPASISALGISATLLLRAAAATAIWPERRRTHSSTHSLSRFISAPTTAPPPLPFDRSLAGPHWRPCMSRRHLPNLLQHRAIFPTRSRLTRPAAIFKSHPLGLANGDGLAPGSASEKHALQKQQILTRSPPRPPQIPHAPIAF